LRELPYQVGGLPLLVSFDPPKQRASVGDSIDRAVSQSLGAVFLTNRLQQSLNCLRNFSEIRSAKYRHSAGVFKDVSAGRRFLTNGLTAM